MLILIVSCINSVRLSSKNTIWFAWRRSHVFHDVFRTAIFSFYHRNKLHEKHPQLERKCMSVSVEGNSFSEETAFQDWAVIPVYVSGSSFSLNLRKMNCIHNRMAFLCKLCVQSPHQSSRVPTRTAGWSPPCTNKQDPRPLLISVDYVCQQWFRKLMISYLHQYQTFL